MNGLEEALWKEGVIQLPKKQETVRVLTWRIPMAHIALFPDTVQVSSTVGQNDKVQGTVR